MSLADFLKMLKEKWYLLVLLPLVFALATAAYCWRFMADVYTSSATLYALTSTTVLNADGTEKSSTQNWNEGTSVASDVLALAKSERVAEEVAKSSGMASLGGYSISTQAGDSKRVIKLSVTGPEPEKAALIANNVAKELTLLADNYMGMEGINVIDAASVPTSPSGPDRMRYVGIAAVVGFCVALALIVILDLLNMTVRSDEDAEEEFGLPVLGRVPYIKRLK